MTGGVSGFPRTVIGKKMSLLVVFFFLEKEESKSHFTANICLDVN